MLDGDDIIEIRTCEGNVSTILRKHASASVTLSNLMSQGAHGIIPLDRIDSKTFEKFATHAKWHEENDVAGQEPPKKGQPLCEFDKEFVEVDKDTLLSIILAANYLEAKQLLTLACRGMADLLKGKSSKEARAIFNMKDPVPDEEIQKTLEENAYFCGTKKWKIVLLDKNSSALFLQQKVGQTCHDVKHSTLVKHIVANLMVLIQFAPDNLSV